ncbi:MAG TPA: TrkH family potassium uptake protein, partial [bacterium]|nr:TrkH family potassium uptake protein [bacterium]
VLILFGTLALRMPGSIPEGFELGWIDALFTSTSAVCVTGLTVVDTGGNFSLGGEIIILILIQAGGLGMLTISNWLLVALSGSRISLSDRFLLEETHGFNERIEPTGLLRRIIRFTVLSEGLGALVLFLRFIADYPFSKALWLAVFHSVAAFCNAGFSLFPDNLMAYRDDWVINLTIIILIVLGGIGFMVCSDVVLAVNSVLRRRSKRWRMAWRRITLHTKVTLITTGILILAGALLVILFESQNLLKETPIHQRLLPALFLSVTSRTAGFNTLDTGQLTNVTLLMTVLLMFIGASPGSTGGGMKTTTLAILIAFFRSRMLNRPRTEILARSVPESLVAKAVVTWAAFVALLLIGVAGLEYFEFGFASHGVSSGSFLDLLFEVTSALGTVGLSVGITPSLEPGSRLVLIVIMFLGRVGPLAVAASFIGQRRVLRYTLPEERIMVG